MDLFHSIVLQHVVGDVGETVELETFDQEAICSHVDVENVRVVLHVKLTGVNERHERRED